MEKHVFKSRLAHELNIFLSIVFTYLFICFTLVLFNSATLSDAALFIKKMHQSISVEGLGVFGRTNYVIIILGSVLVIFLDFLEEFKGISIFTDTSKLLLPVRWAIYLFLSYMVVFHGGPETTFIYMQF